MKLFPFFKSMSRTVHEELRQDGDAAEPSSNNATSDDDGACTSLTVWRRSLVMSCDGFTVIDSGGNLVYRVDNYMGRPEPLVLMDPSGKSLLSMSRRKKLGLMLPEWIVYEGQDRDDIDYSATTKCDKKPICCVRKNIINNMNMLQSRNGRRILAYVFMGGSSEGRSDYVIEGSYANRSCKVSNPRGRVVAEIKRKEAAAGAGVCFGADVFVLTVHSGLLPVFAMALVLILDQMF